MSHVPNELRSIWPSSQSCALTIYSIVTASPVMQLHLWGVQGHCWLADGPDRRPAQGGHRVWLRARRSGWHVEGPGHLQLQGHPQLSTEHWCVENHWHVDWWPWPGDGFWPPLCLYASVHGHAGRLVFGTLKGRPCVCMQGRFHLYEGYLIQKVRALRSTRPQWAAAFHPQCHYNVCTHVSRLRCLCASSSCSVWRRCCWPTRPEASTRTSKWETLWSSKTILTCPALLVIIRWLDPMMSGRCEHSDINSRDTLRDTWWRSPPSARFGVRFPCMSDAYDRELQQMAMDIGQELGYGDFLKEGVYCLLGGPSFETVAESRMLHKLGVDAVGTLCWTVPFKVWWLFLLLTWASEVRCDVTAVWFCCSPPGMSTVYEVIVARHCGMRVFALSLITNQVVMDYDSGEKANHEEVLHTAKLRAEQLERLVSTMVTRIEHKNN